MQPRPGFFSPVQACAQRAWPSASWLRFLNRKDAVDLAAAALQSGAAHPVVAATIPGASSPEHLRRTVPQA